MTSSSATKSEDVYQFDCSTSSTLWTRLDIGRIASSMPSHNNGLLIWSQLQNDPHSLLHNHLTLVPGPGDDTAVHTHLPMWPGGIIANVVANVVVTS